MASSIEEIIGATIIVAISAVAVSKYRIFGISIANVLSIFLILVLAWKNGVLVGSTIGVSIGLILGIIGIPLGILSGIFAIYILVNVVNYILKDYVSSGTLLSFW